MGRAGAVLDRDPGGVQAAALTRAAQVGGFRPGRPGAILTTMQAATTADGVWAMGECAGTPQFTHVAYDDFRIVQDNLHGAGRTTVGRLVPFCLFLDPELARVGCSETEVQRRGVPYRRFALPMAAVLRTRTLSEPRGFMKMLVAADSDEILGFTAFGAEASELMTAVQVAMLGRLPYTVLRDAILTHPTTAEGLTYLLRGTSTVMQASGLS